MQRLENDCIDEKPKFTYKSTKTVNLKQRK